MHIIAGVSSAASRLPCSRPAPDPPAKDRACWCSYCQAVRLPFARHPSGGQCSAGLLLWLPLRCRVECLPVVAGSCQLSLPTPCPRSCPNWVDRAVGLKQVATRTSVRMGRRCVAVRAWTANSADGTKLAQVRRPIKHVGSSTSRAVIVLPAITDFLDNPDSSNTLDTLCLQTKPHHSPWVRPYLFGSVPLETGPRMAPSLAPGRLARW